MSQLNRVDRIRIAGFKSIEVADVELGALNVLIGANGAGKSNFLSVFSLLNSLTVERLQEFVGKQGGASALLHYGPKRTGRLALTLEFRSKDGKNVYKTELVHVSPDTLLFGDEAVEYHPSGKDPRVYDLHGGHRETRLVETMEGAGPGSGTARFVKYRLDRWHAATSS